MSKAEERACQYTGYCKNKSYSDFLNGYHQAEEELKLGWKDINTIIGLYNDLDDKILCYSPEQMCKEILKQFKERKEK